MEVDLVEGRTMECKHGLDTRWCAVCIHGPRPPRPSRQPPPPIRGRSRLADTADAGQGLADLGADGSGREHTEPPRLPPEVVAGRGGA
jgi:hypothetical protein